MFDWAVGTFTFIIGTFIGSFLNVISDRLYLKQDFVRGRSRCEKCHKELHAKNLIPVISFLLQKGKCSFCHKKISVFYPLSEIITGVTFLVAYYLYVSQNLNYLFFIYLLFTFSFYLIISFTDFKYYEIPFEIVVIGSVFSILFRTFILKTITFENILSEIVSVIVVFAFFYFIIWVSKGGMGGGDLKLACFLSLSVGYPAIISALYFGFILGGVFGVLVLVFKLKDLKSVIPFGPFLILGAVLSLFFNLF